MIINGRVAGLAALLSGPLFLGACSPGVDDAPKSPRAQTQAAKPMSIQQYGTSLESAARDVDTALKGLEKAKGYKGLADRITAVQDATQRAVTALGDLTPPSEVAADHQRLVGALRRAYTALDLTGDQVGQRQLCTGPAARAAVGDDAGTAELRAAMKQIESKLPGARLALSLPRAGQKVASRPSNGDFIRSGSRNGQGRLTIDNGGDDALVTLRKGKKTAFSVYVRKGKKVVVNGIPDGDYKVYFTGGSGWDKKARAFSRDCDFQRFEDSFDFTTKYSSTRITYQTWTITLHTVSDGNAETSDVDPGDYPES